MFAGVTLLFAGVNFLSIMGISSGFESENGIAWSAPRGLIAQGVGCGVATMVGSAPISGSMSHGSCYNRYNTVYQMLLFSYKYSSCKMLEHIFINPFIYIVNLHITGRYVGTELGI